MSEPYLTIVDYTFKTLAVIAAALAIFQLREVPKKRLKDMYWKIADIYYSDEQRTARQNIWLLQTSYLAQKLKANLTSDELVNDYYDAYHNAAIKENKEVDTSIINRIRF
jgi:hypothetical protein